MNDLKPIDIKNRVIELCKLNNITITKMCEDTYITRATIYNWSNCLPSLDTIINLSKYFNVPITYILGISNNRVSVNSLEKKNKIDELNSYLDKLSIEDIDILLRISKSIYFSDV